jgi:hypothetical protein
MSAAPWWSAVVSLGRIDLSCYVDDRAGVTVRHGRTNSTEQPSPNSASFELVNLPPEASRLLDVGTECAVDIDTAAPTPILDSASWRVDAGTETATSDGLEDLSGNGRPALYGAGAAAPTRLAPDPDTFVRMPAAGTTSHHELRLSGGRAQGDAAGADTFTGTVRYRPLVPTGSEVYLWRTAAEETLGSFRIRLAADGTIRYSHVIAGTLTWSPELSWSPATPFADGWHTVSWTVDRAGVSVTFDTVDLGNQAHTQPRPAGGLEYGTPDIEIGGAGCDIATFAFAADGDVILGMDDVEVRSWRPDETYFCELFVQRPRGGNVFAATNAASTATYRTVVVDRPLLVFEGAQHAATAGAGPSAAEHTLLAVWRTYGAPTEQETYLETSYGAAGGTTPGRTLLFRPTSPVEVRAQSYNTASTAMRDGVAVGPQGENVYAGTFSREWITAYGNGLSDGGTSTSSPPAAYGGAGRVALGTQWSGGTHTRGELVAAAVWDRALTEREVIQAGAELTGQPQWRHFAGTISDVEAVLAPDGGTINRVVAVSSGLGAMAKRIIGDVPWLTERDGQRIENILDAAAIPKGLIDTGTVSFMARDVDAQDALDLASTYAAQAFGYLVDGRDGRVGYQDAGYRNPSVDVPIEVPCRYLLSEPVAAQRAAALVNRVRIRWGSDPQPEYTAQDTDSIDEYGLYEQSLTTELAAQADAEHIANQIVSLYSQPRWGTEVVTSALHTIPEAAARQIAGLPVSSYLNVTGGPQPLSDPWQVWLEGAVDVIRSDSWMRDLLVSDRYMSPIAEGEPSEPHEDCATFDWTNRCQTPSVFPTNPTPIDADRDGLWDNGGTVGMTASWIDTSESIRVRLLTGAEGLVIAGIGTAEIMLLPEFGTHPDPFTGAADAPDYCIGWAPIDYSGWTGTAEYASDWLGNPPWNPCSLTFVGTGWQWCPSALHSDTACFDITTEQYWADGYRPPSSYLEQGAGCMIVPNSDYEVEAPGLSRVVPTPTGHWRIFFTVFAFPTNPDETMPTTCPVRVTSQYQLEVPQFRWSRARYATT